MGLQASKKKILHTLILIAVIAIALFVIWFILGYLYCTFMLDACSDHFLNPFDSAVDTFNEAYSAQYLLVTSQRVEFEKDMTLTRELIIHKTNVGIVGQQLCLSLGDFSGNSEFQGTTQMITYKGNNSREAKFSALCAPGKELLSQIGEVGQYPEIKKEWVSDCECVTDPALQEQVCCLVALRAPR